MLPAQSERCRSPSMMSPSLRKIVKRSASAGRSTDGARLSRTIKPCARSVCESSPRLAPTGCVSLMAEPVGELRHLTGLWARAHHEAAHAVVATLMGGRVEEIELWSGPPVGGRVHLTGLDVASSA